MRVEILFDKSDLKMLSKPIPDNPCSTCRESFACGGCPEAHAYEEEIKPYKDAGIFDYAVKLKNISHTDKQIRELRNQLESDLNTLPEELKSIGRSLVTV